MQGPPPPLSKRIFNKYDSDGNGFICSDEFHDMCYDLGYALSREETDMAVKLLDHDGNGHITYDEFVKWWRTDKRFAKLQLDEAQLERLQAAVRYFQYFDKDRSGILSREEFKNCHADLVKNNLTQYSFDDMVAQIDNNNDGEISFNEFTAWLGYH